MRLDSSLTTAGVVTQRARDPSTAPSSRNGKSATAPRRMIQDSAFGGALCRCGCT